MSPHKGSQTWWVLKKFRRSKTFHGSIFWDVPNVINNAGCTFLPFNLISPPHTTSYHFSSYLAYFPSIVAALRYSSSFSVQQRSVTQNMKIMGKNVHPALSIMLGAPYFRVLCDRLLLYGQTTAISITLGASKKCYREKFYFDGFFRTHQVWLP